MARIEAHRRAWRTHTLERATIAAEYWRRTQEETRDAGEPRRQDDAEPIADPHAAERPEGAGPDPGTRRTHLRAASRRLGRRRHQDRAAGNRRRGCRRQPPRLRLPEPAPQQARDDAEPEDAGGSCGVHAP